MSPVSSRQNEKILDDYFALAFRRDARNLSGSASLVDELLLLNDCIMYRAATRMPCQLEGEKRNRRQWTSVDVNGHGPMVSGELTHYWEGAIASFPPE